MELEESTNRIGKPLLVDSFLCTDFWTVNVDNENIEIYIKLLKQ